MACGSCGKSRMMSPQKVTSAKSPYSSRKMGMMGSTVQNPMGGAYGTPKVKKSLSFRSRGRS